MKEVLIISPGKLPVPATNGGAVEGLIEQFIVKNNNNNKHYHLSIYTNYSDKSKEKAKMYDNINFYFVDTNSFSYKIKRIVRYIFNRIPNVYFGNEYISRVNKMIKKSKKHYDLLIIENSPEYILKLDSSYYNKSVLHLHNDFLNSNINQCSKILKKYDSVYCLSNFVSNRVMEIDPSYNGVKTLYNGVDFSLFKENSNLSTAVMKKYNIDKDDFVFLYSGRIVKEKGVKELIEAFKEAFSGKKNVKLLICGDISKKNNYINSLIEMKHDNIIFTDYINKEKLPLYYNIAKVGVVPTLIEEGFGLIIIENYSCGNPVIVTNSGGMPELVNSKTGIIIERNNVVDNLKKAMSKIIDMEFEKDNIIKYSHNYSIESYCDNFDKYIRSDLND